MIRQIAVLLLGAATAMFTDKTTSKPQSKNAVEKRAFGKTPEGGTIDLYVLKNKNGVEADVITFGATLISLKTPDRSGNMADVVLGYKDLDGYVNDKAYLGATVGRYANRIANGKFTLDGKTYQIPKNNGENALHGGIKGFNKHLWTAHEVSSPNGQAVRFSYVSKDGEEGFP